MHIWLKGKFIEKCLRVVFRRFDVTNLTQSEKTLRLCCDAVGRAEKCGLKLMQVLQCFSFFVASLSIGMLIGFKRAGDGFMEPRGNHHRRRGRFYINISVIESSRCENRAEASVSREPAPEATGRPFCTAEKPVRWPRKGMKVQKAHRSAIFFRCFRDCRILNDAITFRASLSRSKLHLRMVIYCARG